MSKNLFFSLSLFGFLNLFLVSCSDDGDTTKPLIENLEPANGDTLKIGGAIHFEADFSDNEELTAYSIDIHNNFDGHNHTKSVAANSSDSVAYSFTSDLITKNVAGLRNAHVHHHDLVIPATMKVDGVDKPIKEGKYHFTVYLYDTAGNMSYKVVEVILSNKGGEDIDEI